MCKKLNKESFPHEFATTGMSYNSQVIKGLYLDYIC